MRFHLLGLPHTQTTSAYNNCAYTARNRKWATMMHQRGHNVFLYGGDENEADCTELVSCTTRAEQDERFAGEDWYRDGFWAGFSWDDGPAWRAFNQRAISAVRERVEPHDFILLSAGYNQRSVRDAFPAHLVVEPGVGYQGVCTDFRVFESYAWMHTVYGWQQTAAGADGRFYDVVIPNFFELADFPEGHGGEQFVFMSRMTRRKGWQVAFEATQRHGSRLDVYDVGGERPPAGHVTYMGLADRETRARALGSARAVFVPTLYVEPFGGVAIEAMLCGTPVITTDWGAFTETVRHGIDGFRCRTMREFVEACDRVEDLDRAEIRRNAIARWSTDAVAPQFERYFDRLDGLRGDGFYK